MIRTLVSGAKDIPRNASWLAGKALPHESAGNGVHEPTVTRRAADAIRDAIPGQDSVEARLSRAHQGAEDAQEAEERAVRSAERAHDLVERVGVVRTEEKLRLEEVQDQQDHQVEDQVDAARREADEHVAQVRGDAEARATAELEKQRHVSVEREEAAQEDAERAQQEAQELLAEATERLAHARELADEAAARAQEAAERARDDAERLSNAAQQGRRDADDAVARAEGLREDSEKEAARVTRVVNRSQRPGALTSMAKSDLLHLAQERDLSGRSSMSKKQLIAALEKKQ